MRWGQVFSLKHLPKPQFGCLVRVNRGYLYLAFAIILDSEKNCINGSFSYYNKRKMHGRIIHMCTSLTEVLDWTHILIHVYVHKTNIPMFKLINLYFLRKKLAFFL